MILAQDNIMTFLFWGKYIIYKFLPHFAADCDAGEHGAWKQRPGSGNAEREASAS